jgi:hypothetical protein
LNILDFKAEELKGPVLEKSFALTNKLFLERYKSYQPTVRDLDVPLDIDTYEGQVAMKDYLEIRTVEELMEMREAMLNSDMVEHVHEEVGDSFNFLLNSFILYGWGADKFVPIERLWNDFNSVGGPNLYRVGEIDKAILQVVYDIVIACNKLKIRPWKKSQYLTDILVWEERLEKVYYSYMNLIFNLNIHPEMLWSICSRKNQCNVFRIDTGY